MDDELYAQPEIEEENEGDEEGEGSSAAAAAERMAAEAESGSAGADRTPTTGSAVSRAQEAASGGSIDRSMTPAVPANGENSSGQLNEGGKLKPQDGGKLKPSEKETIRELQDLIENKEKKSVVEKLGTGDTLVRDGKTQHLFMPNGDHLQVNPDGSYELDTKQAVKISTSKDGVTKISYGNGHAVEFDSQGIRGIQRGKEGVSFARKNEAQHSHGHGEANTIPNVIRELKPIKPNSSGSPESGSSAPNVIRELPNAIPSSPPEAGSSSPRNARPAESSGGGRQSEITPQQLDQLRNALRRAK